MGNSLTRQAKLVIDTNAGQAAAELQKISIAIRNQKRELTQLQATSTTGSRATIQAEQRIGQALAENLARRKMLTQQLNEYTRTAQVAAGASTRMNTTIMAGSFAMDDFLTVLQGRGFSGAGVVAGLQAAANNVSMLLAQFNPMLAIVPAATTALISLAYKLTLAGDNAESAGEKTKRYTQALEDMRRKDEEIRLGSQQARAEREMGQMREVMVARKEDVAARIEALKVAEKNLQNAPQVGFGDMYGTGAGANDRAAFEKAVVDRRNELKESMDALREERKQYDRIQREYQVGTLQRRGGEFIGIAQQEMQKAIAGGASRENVLNQITGPLTQRIKPNEKEQNAFADMLGRMYDEARQKVIFDNYNKTPDSPQQRRIGELELRQAEVGAGLASIEAAKAAAEVPGGHLKRAQREQFDSQAAPLKAEMKELTAEIAKLRLDMMKQKPADDSNGDRLFKVLDKLGRLLDQARPPVANGNN